MTRATITTSTLDIDEGNQLIRAMTHGEDCIQVWDIIAEACLGIVKAAQELGVLADDRRQLLLVNTMAFGLGVPRPIRRSLE